MSVIVYAESANGKIKKSAFELVTVGKKIAQSMGTECIALTTGKVENAGGLGNYGADKVVGVEHASLDHFDSQIFTSAISQGCKQLDGNVLILSHSSTGKAIAGRLSIKLDAGLVTSVNELPNTENGQFIVRKPVFAGKAFNHVKITSDQKIITWMGNSIPVEKSDDQVEVETLSIELTGSSVKVLETKTQEGTVPLPEAEVVVSAGRGMKGPENWGIVEKLAELIQATTACSRPVADTGWRPHHEHVGQTGIAIRPNLYIAIGISGAIQHLAGVNSSKVIVVINKDPEAPFFKAADYGVCADLFDVVPRLIESIEKFKSNN